MSDYTQKMSFNYADQEVVITQDNIDDLTYENQNAKLLMSHILKHAGIEIVAMPQEDIHVDEELALYLWDLAKSKKGIYCRVTLTGRPIIAKCKNGVFSMNSADLVFENVIARKQYESFAMDWTGNKGSLYEICDFTPPEDDFVTVSYMKELMQSYNAESMDKNNMKMIPAYKMGTA